MIKTCIVCDEPLPKGSTKRRLYCSDTCRQRAKRARDKVFDFEPESLDFEPVDMSFDD